MARVRLETFTEEETLPAGAVGRVVWAPFSSNFVIWGQIVTIYKFPHSGNVYMVTVCFETLTEAETNPPKVVGRVAWGPLVQM